MPQKNSQKDDPKDALKDALEKELEDAKQQAEEKDAKDAKGAKTTKKPNDKDTIQELEDALKRAQAEMVNYRNRMEKERQDLVKYASKKTLQDILPILDTFEMAAKHVPDTLKNDNWALGITHILSQFLTVLENLGVKKIETVGKTIDYTLHEAVQTVEGDKDMIINEVQAGYSLNGMVLRVAKVEVGKG